MRTRRATQGSFDFNAFKTLWRQLVIGDADVPRKNVPRPAERQCELYELARSRLADESAYAGVGALFALYVLFETQYCEPAVAIPLVYGNLLALQRLRDALTPYAGAAGDALRADEHLRRVGAYSLVADGTLGTTLRADAAALAERDRAGARLAKRRQLSLLTPSKAGAVVARRVPRYRALDDYVQLGAVESALETHAALRDALLAALPTAARATLSTNSDEQLVSQIRNR